jgi:two-component system NarL family response regulator
MSIRILIADDHQMLREGLRAILEKQGNVEVVGEAGDGRTAVGMARELVPDVVAMDISMPDLNGVEATRQIKAENPAVKVIALSRHSDERYVRRMLEAGASGYVLKSGAYDELRRAVEAVIGGNHYLSPSVTGVVIDTHLRGASEPQASGQEALGPREREIVQLLAEGHTSPEIARRLHISTRTVEGHRRNITRKLNLHSIAELTKYAIREGLTSAED